MHLVLAWSDDIADDWLSRRWAAFNQRNAACVADCDPSLVWISEKFFRVYVFVHPRMTPVDWKGYAIAPMSPLPGELR
jgi:hypothetical protein